MNAPTTAVAPIARKVPIIDDPDVREAFEAALRITLEDIASKIGPLIEHARSLPDMARIIPVTSEEEHDFYRSWFADEVDAADKSASEIIDPVSSIFFRLHRSFTALRSLVTDETKKAREIGKPKIVAWSQEVQRRQRAAEEKARLEREAVELRNVIERGCYLIAVGIAQWAELEENRRTTLAAAERARDAGDHEVAEALVDEAQKVETPKIQPEFRATVPTVTPVAATPAKPKGIAKNFKGRLRRPLIDLVCFVAEHPEWETLLEMNQGAVDKAAKLHEDKLSQVVPPLEAYDDPTIRKPRGR